MNMYRKIAVQRVFLAVILALLGVSLFGCSLYHRRPQPSPNELTMPFLDEFYPAYQNNHSQKYTDIGPGLKLLVRKRKRTLLVLKDGKPLLSFKVALSQIPWGDKQKKGDKHTPEGQFFVTKKNIKSKYYLSLELSYPTIKHAMKGLKAGLISEGEFDMIVKSIQERERPPQDTPLGGYICIHGGGINNDWTDGCVALRNKDIKELFQLVKVGTPVTITP